MGTGASASADNTIAFGTNASASQADAIAMGRGANSSGTASIAIGQGAVATGSIAVGASANAGNGGAEFGDGATANTGTDASAFGTNAVATGNNAVALGQGSSATNNNAVALGSGSVTTEDNTVSVGSVGSERRITNTAAGTADTDAANMGQLRALGANAFSNSSAIAGNTRRIDDLDDRLDDVGSMAAALSALVPNSRAKGDSQFSMGMGQYKSSTSMAAGMFHYVNDNVLVNAGVSTSLGADQETAARVGFTIGFN